MRYIVLGYDGKDDQALDRRMAFREAHVKNGAELASRGEWVFSSAILDDDGKMIGSLIVCDFPSKQELDDYLAKEPFVTGKVWEKIVIHGARVSDFYDIKFKGI